MHASAAATAPYFFLSYAHMARDGATDGGEPDYWVSEFYRDLCRSIERQARLLKGAAAGYMERARRQGGDPAAVNQALGNCRTFVPLYSSRYFADDDCGREWNFFVSRMPDTTAIIPVMWDPVDPGKLQPARAPRVKYHGVKSYEALGLYGIMKVSRFRGEYARVVDELASDVLSAAQGDQIMERTDIDYRTLPSAFAPAGAAAGKPGKRIRITVVAPRRDDLPDGRENSSFYASSALDWKPYFPQSVRPIAEHARSQAQSLGYFADVGDLVQHEDDLLSGDPRHGPQILIVDPWALLVPDSQQLLRQVDVRRLPWVQVVIPRSASDEETRNAAGKLQVALESTLRHKLAEVASTSGKAASGVPDPEEFDLILRQLIETVAKNYLSNAAAYPPAGEPVERPRIR